MTEYEQYLEDNGLPYCDYKVHRNKNLEMKPIEKFRHGIRRIMRIVTSYKSTALTDLMEQVREQIKQQKNLKESKRKSIVLKSVPLTQEARNEHLLLDLVIYYCNIYR